MSHVRIVDGTGTGRAAAVDSENRLETHSTILTETVHEASHGHAYNLNTGNIDLTDGSASAIMYFKNNDSLNRDFVLSAFAVGVGTLPGPTESTIVTLVRDPTSVSFSTAVDQNQNRNFGSSNTIAADVYKGAQGATITGGNDIAQFFMTGGSRMFASIDFVIPKGTAMALKIALNDTTGGRVYAALVGYLRDPE